MAEILDRVEARIADDRVGVKVLGDAAEPTGLSPIDGPAWRLLERTILECYPDVVIAPSLVLATTDSRHYKLLSPNVYRFSCLRLESRDLARIHGIDERIAIADYLDMVRFYVRLIMGG